MSRKFDYFNRILNPEWGPYKSHTLPDIEVHFEVLDEAEEPDEPLTATTPAIVRLVALIIQEGKQFNASRIRFEAGRIQAEIDGQLVQRDTPPRLAYDAVILRIKHCHAIGEDMAASLPVRAVTSFSNTASGEVVWLTIHARDSG